MDFVKFDTNKAFYKMRYKGEQLGKDISMGSSIHKQYNEAWDTRSKNKANHKSIINIREFLN